LRSDSKADLPPKFKDEPVSNKFPVPMSIIVIFREGVFLACATEMPENFRLPSAAAFIIDANGMVPLRLGVRYEAVFRPIRCSLAGFLWRTADAYSSEHSEFMARRD
jgi:hypothetical protein